MSSRHASENRFLTAPTGRLFLAQALPMMVVMSMSGLLTVVDAAFLGHFVGADALAAISLVFPALMATIALSTLVSGGMSSLFARSLGAGRRDEAAAVFARAHGLALLIALLLAAVFFVGGDAAIARLAGGQQPIAAMAWTFLAITVCASPVQFLLGLHADAWRNEGRAGLMAVMSVGVTIANIALNYALIVGLDLGVAGSALGTALAQGLGLFLLVVQRLRGDGFVPLASLRKYAWTGGWRAIMVLGAPVSLSFIGIALVSATVIATLRLTSGPAYAETVAAYGIVTRVFSFTFLPLMALALAMQSIVGNNVGAGLYLRSDHVLRLALGFALAYCAAVEAVLLWGSHFVGTAFIGDPAVVAQVATILQPMLSLYLFTGPILVLALYFQAVGQPARTAALTLAKPFLLSPVLVVALGLTWGVPTLWLAYPIADGLVLVLASAIAIAGLRRRTSGVGFGLTVREEPA